ncbi:MAG: Uma2 family endonuclease [Acidobacteriota bacterium]
MVTAKVDAHHWTRGEYERRVEAGAFEGWKVELVEGALHEVTPQTSRHSSAVRKLARELQACLVEGLDLRQQMPLALGSDSLPEADLAVVPADPDDYAEAHPDRALLVAEVSQTSLRFDRETKQRVYALAGIPEYWILNLTSGSLEVYREPAGSTYRSRTVLGSADEVSPLFAPGMAIRVKRLLPKK